ncbi:MAG: hypothetical protein O3B87_03245 [bacterium]|nr:hypothetical protein [bacterium]
MADTNKGKLIIIEGADGTGKTTQVSLLISYLEKMNIPHKEYDFPQYESFYGLLIAAYLRGDLGELKTVSPYVSALLFALDRSVVATQMQEDIDDGLLLIANRYVTSNMAHQGGRFDTQNEQGVFFSWLEHLEYDQNHMPHEDIVVLLDMPADAAAKLVSSKDPRDYLQGKSKDIQESDRHHGSDTAEMYHYLAHQKNHWHIINCIQDGTIKNRESIHTELVNTLKQQGVL